MTCLEGSQDEHRQKQGRPGPSEPGRARAAHQARGSAPPPPTLGCPGARRAWGIWNPERLGDLCKAKEIPAPGNVKLLPPPLQRSVREERESPGRLGKSSIPCRLSPSPDVRNAFLLPLLSVISRDGVRCVGGTSPWAPCVVRCCWHRSCW